MTTLFLRRYGWEVIFLGANVPLLDLEQAVSRTAANLVILIGSQLHTAANIYNAASQLKDAGILFAFAGPIFSRQRGLSLSIPGFYLGDRLDRLTYAVEAILQNPDQVINARIPKPGYLEARTQIVEKQAIIKADIWEELSNNGIKNGTLQIANDYLLQDIIAALTLNDLDSLMTEIEWVNTMISHQALSDKLLSEYLRVFAGSLDRQIGIAVKMVTDWLRATAMQMDRR
jgi:hypothetical protein